MSSTFETALFLNFADKEDVLFKTGEDALGHFLSTPDNRTVFWKTDVDALEDPRDIDDEFGDANYQYSVRREHPSWRACKDFAKRAKTSPNDHLNMTDFKNKTSQLQLPKNIQLFNIKGRCLLP